MLTPLKHLLSLILPLGTCLFLASAPHTSVSALAWTLPFWGVLALDVLTPQSALQHANNSAQSGYYNTLLIVLTGLQLINIVLMLNYVSQLSWQTPEAVLTSLINLVVIRFVVGTSSGTSAIVVAHELIHRRQWYWQLCGRLLLISVCYDHFIITHKQGHHQSLGQTDDIATAKFGESFNTYWRRVSLGHIRYAWHSEQQRLNQGVSSVAFMQLIKNQVLQGIVFELALIMAITLYFGWLAGAVFVYQAIAAVRILEAVNYFQHWGLTDGRFGQSYGWVNHSWLTNYLFIGLANHIGHHQDENAPYYQIPYSNQGPQLPYGYFLMNLWVKLANASYQRMAEKELRRYQSQTVKPAG